MADKKPWTQEQREAAALVIMARSGANPPPSRFVIDLQCEHTALYEALERLVREEEDFEPIPQETLNHARAALSAALPK